MGLFIHDDPSYDPSIRQTGFYRYRQLLSECASHWFLVDLVTLMGATPLAIGVAASIMTASVVVLIPASLVGGMIFGPFLAGMFDAVLRGLRDDNTARWANYRKSWKQNWKGSLLPGAFLGLLLGMYSFMTALLLLWSERAPSLGTVVLYLFSALLLLVFTTLYWPQLVLFQQTMINRLRNIILFTSKYIWKVLGAALLQLLYIAILVLFAPWSLTIVPFLGMWYIMFLTQFIIYDDLNRELHIEEQFATEEDDALPPAEEEEDI